MLVSVIIPTLNEEAYILDALCAARQEYGDDEVEIVVVDGGSQDSTCDLIPPDVPVIRSKPNRGTQMNMGVAHSHGEFLVFYHANSLLPKGWREAVMRRAIAVELPLSRDGNIVPTRDVMIRLVETLRAVGWALDPVELPISVQGLDPG